MASQQILAQLGSTTIVLDDDGSASIFAESIDAITAGSQTPVLLTPVWMYAGGVTAGDRFFFTAGPQPAVYVTDGTPQGTFSVAGGSLDSAGIVGALGDRVVIADYNRFGTLYYATTDGRTLVNITGALSDDYATAKRVTASHIVLTFEQITGMDPPFLWATDGTPAGSGLVDETKTASGDLLSDVFHSQSGAVIAETDYNADGSIFLDFTIGTMTNGDLDLQAASGTWLVGKPFASLDKIESPSGTLLSETQNNTNGSAYQQIGVSTDSSNSRHTYHFEGGSFFTGKAFSAYDNLATSNDILLAQTIDNRDGSHTITAPASDLILNAIRNDTFDATGSRETIRFGASGFGTDVFNGYKAGDVFSFATSVFAGYAALSQHVSGTSSAVISDAFGDRLTLAGVAVSDLTASMFKFA